MPESGSRRARAGVRLTLAAAIVASPLVVQPAFATAGEDAVARVDGETISGAEYRTYAQNYVRSKLYHGGSPERVRELADEALDNLIVDRLLAKEAAERGIKGDADAVAKRIEAIRAQYSGSDAWAQIEPNLPAIEQDILVGTQIESLREQITTVGKPNDAELRRFHAENTELFTEPRSWELDIIMIGVPPSGTAADWLEASRKAEAAVAEVKGGKPFAEVAKATSTHASAAEGGAVGRVHDGQLPENAVAALSDLSPGELTEPVRVLEGYAVFRLNARNDARPQPFEAVEDRVRALYDRDEGKRRWQKFIQKLRAGARIETFDVSSHVNEILKAN